MIVSHDVDGVVRSSHPLGSGVVRAVPKVPPPAGRPHGRRLSRATHGPDFGSPWTARWLRSTTTWRCARSNATSPDLVGSGQLAIGPWRVLMDEFLCSGETMIRNLEMGLRDAAGSDPAWRSAIYPTCSATARRCPSCSRSRASSRPSSTGACRQPVDHHEFWWESPDGTVSAPSTWPTATATPPTSSSTAGRRDGRPGRRRPGGTDWYGGRDFLAIYGTDHAAPLPSLMDRCRTLARTVIRVRVGDHHRLPRGHRPPQSRAARHRGELRSHARANILPGVLSVRWHLKEAMAAAERLLARYAEPFAALCSSIRPLYLELAWRDVIDSSCHDSVTGCGVDETAVQVLARLPEGSTPRSAVRDRALVAARPVAEGSLVIGNPLAEATDHHRLHPSVPDSWGDVAVSPFRPDTVRPTQEVDRPERVLAARGEIGRAARPHAPGP